MPLQELAARADELRGSGKPIVVYCCSQGGVASTQAVALLRGLGFDDVRAIAGGFQRWVSAGFVVEVPPDGQ
jgi:rhodanese-related sulfurtransferase